MEASKKNSKPSTNDAGTAVDNQLLNLKNLSKQQQIALADQIFELAPSAFLDNILSKYKKEENAAAHRLPNLTEEQITSIDCLTMQAVGTYGTEIKSLLKSKK